MKSTENHTSRRGWPLRPPPDRSRRQRGAALAFAIGVIAVATLTPSAGSYSDAPASCFFICGSRGLADTIANILLFLPFGFALALSGISGRRALLLGMAFAGVIEAAQFSIVAGRDASLADVVSNGLGALAGAKLGQSRASWLSPSPLGTRVRLAIAVIGVLAAFGLTGTLVAAWLPPAPYVVQSSPRPDAPAPYSGRILRAWIGELEIPVDGSLGEDAQALLRLDPRLRLHLQVGGRTSEPIRFFRLRAASGSFLVLHADRGDLLLGYHSRAGYYWLADPTLRLRGALGGRSEGDLLPIEVSPAGTGLCIAAGGARECSRFTAASGWTLLQTVDDGGPFLPSALDLLWLAALLVPVGLWSRADRFTAVALGCLVVGSLLVPPAVGLSSLAPWKWLGAAAGLAGGAALARWWRSGDVSRRPISELHEDQERVTSLWC